MGAVSMMKHPATNTTHRESGTLQRGPAFAALARDLSTGLRHLLAQDFPAAAIDVLRAAELRAAIEEADNMARAFDGWPLDAPGAAERIALVNRLARLKQRISSAYR